MLVFKSQTVSEGEPTVSWSVMAAEHRVCDQKNKEHQTQSDHAEKFYRR